MALTLGKLLLAATPFLVAAAALSFAAGLVALWRERSRGQRPNSWFHGLRPAQRLAAAIVVALFTLWGGAKPDGGDRGGEDMPPQPPAQSEVPRSGGTNNTEVTSLCFTSISVTSNAYANLSVAWPTNLFDGVHILDFFSKTNLLEGEWRWIGDAEVYAGETNLAVSVALADIGDGTNAPASAFFHVRDRESCNLTMADRDNDGIPDIYEIRNGTNPYVPDAALAPRLTVGASGDYASIPNALAASTNYSIISLAPETFVEAHPITMPPHPVMLVCEDGYAVVRSSATIGAFVFDGGQDAQTLLRGLYVVLEARSNYQAAFWCGGNLPWSGAPSAPTFEDIRIRAPYPEPQYYGWHFYRYTSGTTSIRRCTINAAGATSMTGIYSFEGPPLDIRGCTAVNFPHNAALYLQSSPANYGGMAAGTEVAVESLALDQSFTNAYMLARFEYGTNFVVSLDNAIMPELPEAPHIPDFMENVCVTNAGISWNGLALPGSAAWNLGIGDVRDMDFSAVADFDGDGLSDHDEVFVYESDPWLADSDGDGLSDGEEIGWGTNPLDRGDFITAASLSVTNATGLPGNIGLALYAGAEPYADPPLFSATFQTDATNRLFEVSGMVFTNAVSCALVAFNDLDADGQCGPLERGVTNTFLPPAGFQTFKVSLPRGLFDNDGDDLPDVWECAHGLSWTNSADAAEDGDLDYLPNLQEYLFGCDPFVNDGSNTVFAAASRSIDERIAGKNPTNALPVFLNYPACGTNLVRNTECWAYGLDLSCASPWNNAWLGGNRKTGTLISSRHIVYAHHYDISNGTILYYVGTNGVVYTTRIVNSLRVGQTDIRIGLLQDDMNFNCVPAKILPSNFGDYIGNGYGIPVISFDQEEKALVQEVGSMGRNISFHAPTVGGARHQFYEEIVTFDSSNPSFLLIDDQPVLLCTFLSATDGPSLSFYAEAIQQTMDSLCAGYELQEVDLTQYRTMP